MLDDAEKLEDVAVVPETGWRLWSAIGEVSIASESTSSGESVSSGEMALRRTSKLSIIISEVITVVANKDRLPPIHPGEVLREEFLVPLGMSAHQLALALRVTSYPDKRHRQ